MAATFDRWKANTGRRNSDHETAQQGARANAATGTSRAEHEPRQQRRGSSFTLGEVSTMWRSNTNPVTCAARCQIAFEEFASLASCFCRPKTGACFTGHARRKLDPQSLRRSKKKNLQCSTVLTVECFEGRHMRRRPTSPNQTPNKAPEPTPMAVTSPAAAGAAPATVVAHL